MKVLLTGACGKVGSVVCNLLTKEGVDIRASDRCRKNGIDVPVIVADLLDREKCYGLVDGQDAIVHLAGHSDDYIRDPQTLLSENVTIMINLLQAALESDVKNIIFTSSIQAITFHALTYYSEEDPRPCSIPYLPVDGDTPANPGNTYGLSKVVCEDILQYYSKKHGMNCVALRLPGIYPVKALGRIRHFWSHRKNQIRKGDELGAYLSDNDTARLILAILKSNLTGFRIYMPSGGPPVTDMPLAEFIHCNYSGIPLRKPVEEMDSLVDISRITEEIGWKPLDRLIISDSEDKKCHHSTAKSGIPV